MARAYSMDLRQRILAAYDAGESAEILAKTYRVSARWIYQILRRRKETGSIAPLQGKRGRKSVLFAHRDKIRELLKEQPDATLLELREKLGVDAALSSFWRTLRSMKITLKKSHPRGRTAAA